MIAGFNMFPIVAQGTFKPLDTGIVIAYIVGLVALGIWAGYRKKTSSTQLFLAGRSLGWPVIGISLFCANISSIHLVGLAADGHRVGLSVGNFEWGASFCLIILGLVFAPFYFKSKLQTLPEYVEKRYSSSTRTILGIIFILSALLVHIGMSLYAGGVLIKEFFGIPVNISIIVISMATALYTVLGGLRAVMITNILQVVILLTGAITLTYLGLKELAARGITSVVEFKEAITAVKPNVDISMLTPIRDQEGNMFDYSWLCALVGYPVLGIWYWCTDQTIVQNILAAKSEKDGRDGAIFGGFMKILPVFLMVLPGVIAIALYNNKIGDTHDKTLTVLMTELLGPGFLGLFAAGLLAALMSTVAAALNSTATLASSDILKRIKPDTPDRTLVWAGRITSVIVIILAMFWSTQGDKFGSIFVAINQVPMMFAPGITTIFLFGVFWKRGTKQAAITTLLFNMAIGIPYLVVEIVPETKLVTQTWGIPFMLVGGIFIAMCIVVYIIVSLMTPAPSREKLENLVWKHPLEFIMFGKIKGITDPRVMAGMLFALMIVLYIILG
jgi:SSS family solute:Na+ symporter